METSKQRYPIIVVSITAKRLFRAAIKENREQSSYEVTIGGKNWKEGLGRQHELLIRIKCETIVEALRINLETLFKETENAPSSRDWC